MTRFIVSLTGFVCSIALLSAAPTPVPTASAPPKHDGAPTQFDQFIVVLLVRPANAPEIAKDELDKLQEGHLANIRRLHDEGKLLKAGPFEDYSGRNVRGMFILATDSQETAREWIAGDPLIKIGRLAPEFLKWYVEKGSLK